jgi:hypothetical protein
MQITVKLQQRSDIEANWELHNPVLLKGEVAFSIDIYNLKIGDGVTAWKDLPYYMEPLTDDEISALCQ